MAKFGKKQKEQAPEVEAQETVTTEAAAEAAAEAVEAIARAKGPRGPRGVAEDAKIHLLVQANPKRPGSKAHAVFENYRHGMTVKEFTEAVGGDATAHLVYDAKHGHIKIDGHEPGPVVEPKKRAKKEKAEAAPAGEAPAADTESME